MKFNTDSEAIDALKVKVEGLKKEISKKIIGQDRIIDEVLMAIFSKGHVLLVGVPGLAKTLLVTSLNDALGLSYNRVQFTPDLMPSDITGTEILTENKEFKFIKGPIFCNLLLADEINRTPPKTQAALLEAMQEKVVTVSGQSYKLDEPFFVLATQNPIEQEGTYPLPEAQLDRFMFNVWVDYPEYNEELEIVKATTGIVDSTINAVTNKEEILFFQNIIRKIPVSDNVVKYAVDLVRKTRLSDASAPDITKDYISWGAGPRASQNLIVAAKARAAFQGKYSPDIEDVKYAALPVLRHRVVANYKAQAKSLSIDDIIKELL
jgi:MoxR-like ATPase